MLARSIHRSLMLGIAGGLLLLGGCGTVEPEEKGEVTLVDAAPAERVLKAYLDDDRCDLLSERMLQQIAPDPEVGLARCKNEGLLPVDALIGKGQYKIQDAEIIDENGLIQIKLDDGGQREYTLIPGGDEGFLVDEVRGTFAAEVGKPLRLQARETSTSPPNDARIIVRKIEQLGKDDFSEDEYINSLDRYYRVSVSIKSRLDEPQILGSAAFLLTTKEGYPIGEPLTPQTDLGPRLYSELPPGARNAGVIFFAVPREVKAGGVTVTVGTGANRGHLSWKLPDGGTV